MEIIVCKNSQICRNIADIYFLCNRQKDINIFIFYILCKNLKTAEKLHCGETIKRDNFYVKKSAKCVKLVNVKKSQKYVLLQNKLQNFVKLVKKMYEMDIF